MKKSIRSATGSSAAATTAGCVARFFREDVGGPRMTAGPLPWVTAPMAVVVGAVLGMVGKAQGVDCDLALCCYDNYCCQVDICEPPNPEAVCRHEVYCAGVCASIVNPETGRAYGNGYCECT